MSALAQAEEAWFRADSVHFAVYAEGSSQKALRYAQELERFHAAALLMLGVSDGRSKTPRRFDVIIVRAPGLLRRFRPDLFKDYVGIYLQCVDGVMAVASETNRNGRGEDDFAREVLFHEVAHRLMFEYSSAAYPRWFVEGYAEFMAGTDIQERQVTFGLAPQHRTELIDRGLIIPYADVLKPGDRNPATEEAFYAQAWALTHYMMSDPERARRMNLYFKGLAEGADPVASFENVTGLELKLLPNKLKRYIETASAWRVSGKDLRPGEISVSLLSEGHAEVLLSGMAARSCPGGSHGQKLLAELRGLRQQRPNPAPELRLALARAELNWGEAAAADAELTAVLDTNGESFEALHLRGRALVALASKVSGAAKETQLSEAQAHLFAAYRLMKFDAPNLFQLAQLLARKGVDANVLNAARGARRLEPSTVDYAVFEAMAQLHAGQRERAVEALLPLTFNPHDAALAARMRRVIDAIKAGETPSQVNITMMRLD